jgi:hypothetical protein
MHQLRYHAYFPSLYTSIQLYLQNGMES